MRHILVKARGHPSREKPREEGPWVEEALETWSDQTWPNSPLGSSPQHIGLDPKMLSNGHLTDIRSVPFGRSVYRQGRHYSCVPREESEAWRSRVNSGARAERDPRSFDSQPSTLACSSHCQAQ